MSGTLTGTVVVTLNTGQTLRGTVVADGAPPPPPSPPPPATPSPDGTQVTNPSGTLVDSRHRTFRLVGAAGSYKIDCDGKVTGALVERLYAKGGLCYQQNAHKNWWNAPKDGPVDSDDDWVACPDPTGVAPPPAPPPSGAPSMAAAVGYNTRTFGPAVTLGQNWFISHSGGTQTSYGVSITGDGNYAANDHMRPDHGGDNGRFAGIAFGGGGYFEVDMLIENAPPSGWGNDNSGWPAWWMNAAESVGYNGLPQLNNNQNLEYDASEFMDHSNLMYAAAVHHWYGGQDFNDANMGVNVKCNLPAGTNMGQRHKYGWLWVPATNNTKGYIKNFFDRQQVGATYTWDIYKGGSTPNTSQCPWMSVIDIQHSRLILGTGGKNPLQIYSVDVWQKDGSKNLTG